MLDEEEGVETSGGKGVRRWFGKAVAGARVLICWSNLSSEKGKKNHGLRIHLSFWVMSRI